MGEAAGMTRGAAVESGSRVRDRIGPVGSFTCGERGAMDVGIGESACGGITSHCNTGGVWVQGIVCGILCYALR